MNIKFKISTIFTVPKLQLCSQLPSRLPSMVPSTKNVAKWGAQEWQCTSSGHNAISDASDEYIQQTLVSRVGYGALSFSSTVIQGSEPNRNGFWFGSLPWMTAGREWHYFIPKIGHHNLLHAVFWCVWNRCVTMWPTIATWHCIHAHYAINATILL